VTSVRSPDTWERRGPHSEAPRLAIIGPAFFSYVPAIAKAVNDRGVDAAVFDEKHSNRPLAKLLYRLGLHGRRWSPRQAHLDRLMAAIRAAQASDVFLINTEAIDRDFVQRLVTEGRRVHLYMWDGVANKPGFVDLLDLVASRGSFDPGDCERFAMTYIPLFAEPVFERAAQEAGGREPEFDISFCGTVHSSRVAIVAKLLEARRRGRARIGLLLYYHSRALLYAKGLVQPDVWRIARAVSFRSFAKPVVASIFARSRLVLDVPHPGQTGMTARTFEVLLAGARLLTFHRRAAELLPASLAPRVIVVESIEQALALDFAGLPELAPLSDVEMQFLSLDRFVDQLLEMAEIAHAGKPQNPVPSARQWLHSPAETGLTRPVQLPKPSAC